jgi:hypothetical protein
MNGTELATIAIPVAYLDAYIQGIEDVIRWAQRGWLETCCGHDDAGSAYRVMWAERILDALKDARDEESK